MNFNILFVIKTKKKQVHQYIPRICS